MKPAKRIDSIAPFYVMDILRQAKSMESEGIDVIHMEIGEPDFPTPDQIVQAGMDAIEARQTTYSEANGLLALREKIANYYLTKFAVEVNPSNIFVTPGASGALMLALMCCIDADDEVLMPDPGYPCNRNFVSAINGRPVAIPIDESTGYELTPTLVDTYWRNNTAMLMLASPSNPLGNVLSRTQIRDLSDYVSQRDGVLLVDEIYQGLNYSESTFSSLEISRDIIVINSFSKYFGMSGWRLGWVVMPDALVGAAEKVAQNLFIAPSTPAQHAAMAAFDHDVIVELERRCALFKTRRDALTKGLQQIGFTDVVVPEGAFYVYLNVSHLGMPSDQLCGEWLRECHVAVTPGKDFGQHRQDEYIRFAFTTDVARIEEALSRIKKWIDCR